MEEALYASVIKGLAPVLPFVIKKGDVIEPVMAQATQVIRIEPRSSMWKIVGYDTETLMGLDAVFCTSDDDGLMVHGEMTLETNELVCELTSV